MEDAFGHHISYLRVSITDRCNERCRYCMPQELQEWHPHAEILTYEEIARLLRVGTTLGIRKVRITGGEPLTRRNVLQFFEFLQEIPGIEEIGLSTNGTLLAKPMQDGRSMAAHLRERGVNTLNISLDTLDRSHYATVTGRDFLPQVLEGLEIARQIGFDSIKLNAVLMRGHSEKELGNLARFAAERNLLLRFIELMPVSSTEVLDDDNFLPIAEARRILERELGPLIPDPHFRTNGPAAYWKVERTGQRLGFIGAMTNLHFCENCNKLRLTCDGKLRPCLGSHLEFDIRAPLRQGATDPELAEFFRHVVARKPKEHDFRNNYQPHRKMIAIGG